MQKNTSWFTVIEIVISLMIMGIIFGFFSTLVKFSPISGGENERNLFIASKKIPSDLNQIFSEYSIGSGIVSADSVPSRAFDRIGLVYSGWTVIIGIVDKNSQTILDPNSNDTGFLGVRSVSGTLDPSTYTGTLDIVSEDVNITDLRGYIVSGLLRLELYYDTEITNGDREYYTTGYLLYVKNLNH